MAIKRTAVQATSSAPSDVLEAGEYEARLVHVADLGIQAGNPKFDQKDNQQLALCIEIVGHTREYEGETLPLVIWTRSFNIFQTLTEMGNELKMYKVFNSSAKEGQVADWDAALGEPCSVNTVINSRGYAEIESLNVIPKKYHKDVPDALTDDMSVGDVDDEDNPAQKAMFGLPRWLVDNNRVASSGGAEEPEVDAANPYS